MRSYEFRSGALFLDLVDTVADRDGSGADLLGDPKDVSSWAYDSGKLPFMLAVTPNDTDLRHLKALREAIYRAVSSLVDGGEMEAADIRVMNHEAAKIPARSVLTADGVELATDDPVGAMLAAIATDAIDLLGSERRQRLRRCQECRMLFFDASPPGKRLWCSSSSGCGNRAKTRRHRQLMKERKDHPC
jgi:predicted RNA-binding Zn ribbon-like protein